MKDLSVIFLCMFAVFGAYRVILGLLAMLSGKARTVLALRAYPDTDPVELQKNISSAASRALECVNTESEPVILCEDPDTARRLSELGCAVYLRAEGKNTPYEKPQIS